MNANENSKPGLSATTKAVGAVGGVLLLTVGLIGGTLIARTQDPVPGAAAPSSAQQPQPESLAGSPVVARGLTPEAVVDTVGVSDPDVTEWHENARPSIGAVLNVMLSKAPTSGKQLRAMCETLGLTINDINRADDAPQADVNTKFRTWADLLTNAVSDCAASESLPDAEALEAAKQSFEESSRAFDDFMLTLDLYFDFSATEDRPAARPAQ